MIKNYQQNIRMLLLNTDFAKNSQKVDRQLRKGERHASKTGIISLEYRITLTITKAKGTADSCKSH